MSQTRIITVTLNPSLDRTLFTHYLSTGYHNTVTDQTRLDPAGRGINVSRALNGLGDETEAIVLLGGDAIGRAYRALLAGEAFPIRLIQRAGQTRSNTVILDTGQKTETHLIEEGSGGTVENLEEVAASLKATVAPGDIVVLGGMLPRGMLSDTYGRLTAIARGAGAKVLVASSGEVLGAALGSRPDIVAVLQVELESYCNYPVRTTADIIYSAEKICEGGVDFVLVMLEEKNRAMIIHGDQHWLAQGVEAEAAQGSTSGMYDALLAGFLDQYTRAAPLPEMLRYGIAAATFNRERVGHNFGTREEIEPYLETVLLTDDTAETFDPRETQTSSGQAPAGTS